MHHQFREQVALRTMVEGLGAHTGAEFFPALVRNLVQALDVSCALVSRMDDSGSHFLSLAAWSHGAEVPTFRLAFPGTPCETVLGGRPLHVAEKLQQRFPGHSLLVDWRAESYCGVPFRDSSGSITGHLAVLDDQPMPEEPHGLPILEMFAARSGAELERMLLEEQSQRGERMLRRLLEGTVAATGDEFYRSLVENLAKALEVRHAFVSVFAEDKTRVRTLAFWSGGKFLENVEYDIAATPCEGVLAGDIGYYPTGVVDSFPEDRDLRSLDAESYLAIPLRGSSGQVLGHLAVIDDKPMPRKPHDLSVFRLFAARAVAEIERGQAQQAQEESEARLRDLFEEAPIAYVHEGVDTKFIRANRTAMQILGITPGEVTETYGRSLIADTPEAQRRVQAALQAVEEGRDSNGVILELRRKDTGQPLWIRWWSKPDPSGAYTRTMFLDVTETILMEREKVRLEAHNDYLQQEIKSEHNFEEIIGGSPAIQSVFRSIEQVAPTDATVLITGETGTGKELIARAIHDRSRRREGVLVKVNCAAIPAGLIESELFGHEKGAFTGALTRKVGRFEVANGATLFLDEVGEIPIELQSKLLRVLQEGEFERLGSTETQKVDVRVIAATNRDLGKAVQDREFRADLFYRLNVFPIEVPALRERREDIPLLVKFFVWKYGPRMGKRIETISETALQSMQSYSWPGNIRELENVIERAMILSTSQELELGDWMPKPAQVAEDGALPTLQELEKAHILSVLDQTGWRVSGDSGAAKVLGLKPTTLEARMKKHGIVRRSP